MKNKSVKIVAAVLLLSIVINIVLFLQVNGQPGRVGFQNANSRDTYFTLHNVKQAQSISKGKGIKVGILDHYFGCEVNKDLYTGTVDFLDDSEAFNKISEHGFWMANTLKEIAPECDIYAINTLDSDEDKKVTAMIKAIDWAIENKIDILTYSDAKISEKNRHRFDAAVNKAVKNNIITTFIHYDNPNNIWPDGMFSGWTLNKGIREPDLNILNYDYNVLSMDKYKKYKKLKNNIRGGDNIPYFSISSTSPVTAGFIAILKSVNNKLSPNEYRDILKKTSYKMSFKDPFTLEESDCSYVADIGKAVIYLKEIYE